MITLGPRETLQVIDGSTDFAIVQRLHAATDLIGFAAPALAYAGDAIVASTGPERMRLENGLADIFELSQPTRIAGFGAPQPHFTVLEFGRHEARKFPSIREAIGGDAGVLMLQTLAIVATNNLTLWLEQSARSETILRRLQAAGIRIDIEIVT